MAMTERQLQAEIVLTLNKLGALVVQDRQQPPRGRWAGYLKASKGQSDLIVCWRGRFVSIEIKTDEGQERPKQKEFRMRVFAAGGKAYVVRSVDDVLNVLKEVGHGVSEKCKAACCDRRGASNGSHERGSLEDHAGPSSDGVRACGENGVLGGRGA